MANRTDVWGQYLPAADRTPKHKAITKKGLLTRKVVVRHFSGREQGDLIGLHVASADKMSKSLTIDIDHHGEPDQSRHQANRKAAIRLYERARGLGFTPLLVATNGRGGYHLTIVLDGPAVTAEVWRFGHWLVRDWEKLGLAEAPEVFPKQPRLGKKLKFGNWVRLPGRHHTYPYYSKVWNGKRWLRGGAAIRQILQTRGQAPGLVPGEARNYSVPAPAASGRQTGTEHQRKRPTRAWAHRRVKRSIDRFLAELNNVQRCGDQWSARCPAHNDHSNSLSVGETHGGKVLLYCHAGCEWEAILEALSLPPSAIFPPGRRVRPVRRHRGSRVPQHRQPGEQHRG